jgi:SAM-dependent MidA family methyltransferase
LGDYYTSVSVGPLFGELLAFQFDVWCRESGGGLFQVLEAGAHDGRLAADILAAWSRRSPESAGEFEYLILEPSARRQARQQTTLREHADRVRWFRAWEELPVAGVVGVIFANELLDAFPVHRLGWDAATRTWFEWGVRAESDRLVWGRMPQYNLKSQISNLKLLGPGPDQALEPAAFVWPWELPAELLAALPDGFTTEICPTAATWWRQAASALRRGRLLTFDYGLRADEFFRPERSGGTLRAFHRHRAGSDLLANVGGQDLTASVNFTMLKIAGEQVGLRTEDWCSQTHFLTRIAEQTLRTPAEFGPWTHQRTRQVQTLIHPEHLGRAFSVLVQGR